MTVHPLSEADLTRIEQRIKQNIADRPERDPVRGFAMFVKPLSVLALCASLRAARAEIGRLTAEKEQMRKVAVWRGTMLLRYHEPSCRSLLEAFEADCSCGDQDALLRGNAELRAERDEARVDALNWHRWHDEKMAQRDASEKREKALRGALRGLQRGTAHPDDPVLKGDTPCWCDSRSVFAKGPHDDKCLVVRSLLAPHEGEPAREVKP